MRKTRQSGQILLITLLVLSVAITVALSMIARTTTDVSISSQVEESTRAFSAAEAGIEESLKNGIAPGGVKTLADSSTQYTVTQQTIGDTDTYTAGLVGEGETKTIWLIHHDASGNPDYSDANKYPSDQPMYICWSGPNNSPLTPALEVTIYYRTYVGGLYRVMKTGYDQFAGRTGILGEANNFSAPGAPNCNDGGITNYGSTINFTALGIAGAPNRDTMFMIRLRPVYAATRITLRTSNSSYPLPGLGNTFTSCGSSTPGVTRCISADQLYPEPPDIFDYVLYANTGSVQ